MHNDSNINDNDENKNEESIDRLRKPRNKRLFIDQSESEDEDVKDMTPRDIRRLIRLSRSTFIYILYIYAAEICEDENVIRVEEDN